MKAVIALFCCIVALGQVTSVHPSDYQVVEEELIRTPPKPYQFGYAAGRYPGHIDRTHSESSDGSGVVRGSYSYIDPLNQVRTVDYVADENGFHPQLNLPPQETAAVRHATDKHFALYNKIAAEHSQPALAAENVPRDTVSVANAKERHHTLYEKIAQDHARIAAEREAAKALEEQQQLQYEQYAQQHTDQHVY